MARAGQAVDTARGALRRREKSDSFVTVFYFCDSGGTHCDTMTDSPNPSGQLDVGVARAAREGKLEASLRKSDPELMNTEGCGRAQWRASLGSSPVTPAKVAASQIQRRIVI